MMRHDSRQEFYREPFGAQPAGTQMTLRLECDEAVSKVLLRLWWDGREIVHLMKPERDGIYAAKFTLPLWAGLLWYYFVIHLADGRVVYYANAYDRLGGEGALCEGDPSGYQITVYDPAYRTPEWMKRGIMYHIMVDRFYASRPAADRQAPRAGHWHEHWHEDPEISLDAETTDNVGDDFFGGDLRGIEEKLPYLRALGVSVLYLSPIFEARSNHKYNTGDYMRIDPTFGDEEDFKHLCEAAKAIGMRVMLDGVFSHTGSDSVYFNREGTYPKPGAFQSQTSPYYSWYEFAQWPQHYETWWGFQTLPVINKRDPAFLDYILRGEDSVFAHWMHRGASGWRLDVADELPMDMMREMRARLKALPGDGALLGEVWDDASAKIAYGEMRCYCLGDTLDSVMNYPLRGAIFDFLLGKANAASFVRRVESMRENYPKPFFYSLMNLIGSHDKARAVNVLSDAFEMEPLRVDRSARKLTDAQYALGRARLLLAMQMLMALPGMPCIYYGDEAGAQGMADPFCRGVYPWGQEDAELLVRVKEMTATRNAEAVWALGELRLYAPCEDVVVIVRTYRGRVAVCAINRAAEPHAVLLAKDEVFCEGRAIRLDAHGMGIWML